MRPGSTAWLLAHEARIQWRGLSGTSRRVTAALGAGLGLILVGAGWAMSLVLDRVEIDLTRALISGVLAATVLVFSLMLAQTLSAAAQSFYARRDLDLLLSSPLPASRVLGARCLSLAANTGALWLFMVTTPAITLAVLGHPRWLGAPLTLAALALLATTLGLWLAMALFAAIGPRRTRTASQVLGAFTGAAFFLVVQARNWLPERTQTAVAAWIERAAGSAAFEPSSALSWPARALLGEPVPLAAFLGVSGVLFATTTAVLGRRFAENAAAAAGREAGRVKAATGDARAFSRGALPATIKKELRLIGRDPALISQVLLRLLYMIPLLALLWRAGNDDATAAIAGIASAVTFMTAQLAGSLARITVTTEDAPDLLACAPAAPSLVRRGKLTAALLPVIALLALPLAGLMAFNPAAGVLTLLTCVGAGVSSGLIVLWLGKPIKRSDFNKGNGAGGVAAIISDLLVSALWGAAAYLGVRFGAWGLAPAIMAVLALTLMRRPASGYAY